MATIDDLLDGPPVIEDVNEALYINPITRVIEVPDAELILGAEHDDRGECKFFRMPKVVGNNVQVSACSLRVYYTNANGDSDYFPVAHCVDKDDCVEFCWELSKKVTAAAGRVKFSICVCRVENDEVQKEWNTTDTYGTVLSNINGAEHEELQPTPDVIDRVERMAAEAKNAAEQARTYSNNTLTAAQQVERYTSFVEHGAAYVSEAATNVANDANAAALSATTAKAEADRAAGVVNAVAELPERVKAIEEYLEDNPCGGESDLSDYIKKEELPDAINDALEQAAASGDFNGEDGYSPVRGTDYWTPNDIAEIKNYVDEAILGGAW